MTIYGGGFDIDLSDESDNEPTNTGKHKKIGKWNNTKLQSLVGYSV